MKEMLYGWVRDIAFYTLLMAVVLHVLPEQNQRKYLQFFMGIVLIILVMSPFLSLTGLDRELDMAYARRTYDRELQDFLKEQEKAEEEYERYVREKMEQEAEALRERAAESGEAKAGEGGEEEEKEKEEKEEGGEEDAGIPEIHIEIETGG